jgi:molybdopterin-containing oxidoreductase family iron-sulfur binding subunit
MGFSTAAVALAACETPVNKAIPYVVKPEEVTPGVANFYASTFYDGHDYASILVKTREGRPIKIEGNTLSGMQNGATSARVQASVLGLYDGARLTGPMTKGAATTWKNADDKVGAALLSGQARILTSTIISPSTKAVIAEFMAKYPNAKHVTYDAVSYSALRKANENVFGKKVVSSYDFSKAKTIVGVACDFLGTWLSPIEFANQYSRTRKVSKENPEMSRHYHFEANMSLTGANADYRYMVKPSDFGKVLVALYNEVAAVTGGSKVSGDAKISNPDAEKAIAKAAKELADSKGRSLVVCGINDEHLQTLVNGINNMLDNYGKTVDYVHHLNLKQGDDKDFIALVNDMNAGKVSVLMTYNCNPVYTAAALKFADAYKKVATKVSFSQILDETAQMADVICPDHNYLESWGDANPKVGHYTLQQPTVNPIFSAPRYEGTRQFQDSLLMWAGVKSGYYNYLQAYWQNHVFPMQGKYLDFPSFWAHTLHDGVLKVTIAKEAPATVMAKDSTGMPIMAGVASVIDVTSDTTNTVAAHDEKPAPKKETAAPAVTESMPTPDYNKAASMAVSAKGGQFELCVYEKVSVGAGTQINNPWLMELPDPITKTTWDNYITMAPADVKAMEMNEMLRQDIEGSVADITVNGVKVTLPVLPQPGQCPGTVGIALGYGRDTATLRVANGIGANAYQFLTVANDNIQQCAMNVSIAKTGDTHTFASTQIQHTIMGREEQILREVSLKEYKEKDKEAYNPAAMMVTHEGMKHVSEIDLWDAHPRMGHKWGLSIDMTTCIGCAACVVACGVENNVAVVGKTEIGRTRDMFWLRIDRYYSSDMTREKAKEEHVGTKQMYLDMETPSHNPKVTFQPMLCQHCNHAPCETVCPVLATSHSTEGLNMMTYNRCIGTRYCANNCPYKVRRFNWFNYNENNWFAEFNPAQQELGRMVLNPDVVVRSRGVMEKCSMCQQRLQSAKLDAKKAGTTLVDGSVKTACQQACPTNAIMFGDVNDTESEISKWRQNDRNYFLLEEVGTKPTVSYMVKVRNQDEPILHEEGGHVKMDEHREHAEEKSEEKHS